MSLPELSILNRLSSPSGSDSIGSVSYKAGSSGGEGCSVVEVCREEERDERNDEEEEEEEEEDEERLWAGSSRAGRS
jgi:Ran GTPase-activating protein (RanGAP) involved in mRNA processing and transport